MLEIYEIVLDIDTEILSSLVLISYIHKLKELTKVAIVDNLYP